MALLNDLVTILLLTCKDILPIVILIIFFQLFVLRQAILNPKRLIVGGIYVVLGLTLFLAGLEKALFPLGEIMAIQLSDPAFIYPDSVVPETSHWFDYRWIYIFAAMMGFAATIAEPSLIAVAYKASQVSGGTINQWGLRLTVAVGVAFGISLGTFRIVTGTPLYLYILIGYLIVMLQTLTAPKNIIPLAYDSGGVTTSSVTVPLVTALGLGLASNVPGRNPALDGFGLIAFASLFPIITVLGYAQYITWLGSRKKKLSEVSKCYLK